MEGYEAVFLLAKFTTALGAVVSVISGYVLVQDWRPGRGAFAPRGRAVERAAHDGRETPWRPVFHRKAS